ncbi:secreted lipase [Penicillium angulare]|uniref:Carboxylic ester hydrolase n=1 Tax=Penicillium angulare TaxID=116970 RepID=A0A9W9KN36_9EURO|nr:secreted lipase [Penicillium angulare]
MLLIPLFLLIYLLAAPAASHSHRQVSTPIVAISKPEATFIGSTSRNVDSFHGIPYALAPTGPLRLRPPRTITAPLGIVQLNSTFKSCPQLLHKTATHNLPFSTLVKEATSAPYFHNISYTGEDCLNMNIMRPSGTVAGANLPVLVWVFGGGFEIGSTISYDPTTLITASVSLKMPVIFVAMNYRLGGFGFLPGSEVLKDGAANLGILDQRLALEWVADHIGDFGGDPSKVTIWGQSAGSISVFTQMAMYDGNITYKGSPLFRAAIMSSGSIAPTSPIDGVKGQAVYDSIVKEAGCNETNDTLACLRDLDYPTFLRATNSVPRWFSYNSVALSYLPRPDGTVLTDSPETLVKSGKYALVPFIIGDQEDEGTIFSLFQSNITIETEIVDYLKSIFFLDAPRDLLESLVATYPNITTDGSPFRTGTRNNLYPQYKRIAAVLGDFTFTLARRVFLTLASQVRPEVPSWSYLSSYNYGTPILGTFHGSDILQIFYGNWPDYVSRAIPTYILSFVYDLDPNSRDTGYMAWPQWRFNNSLMNFLRNNASIINDDFRKGSFEVLSENTGYFHI